MVVAPRITSLSNHRLPFGDEIHRIFIYGEGFKDVTSVMIGDTMVQQLWVDSETIMTIEVPHLVAGATYWVQIHTLDGSSPCEGDAQMLTVDAISDTPAAALTVTSIVPDTITLGRTEQYWLFGTGLSKATLAVIGSTPCRIESYDDERLILTVPDQIDGAVDGAVLQLDVSSPEKSVRLQVPCATGAAPPPGDEEWWPGVTSVEPVEVPSAGGQFTVHGYRLADVTTVTLGTVGCTVQTVSADHLIAIAPSLEAHVGEHLPVALATATWASPLSSDPVTVLVAG